MFSFITSNLIWTESLWLILIIAIVALIGWFIARPITYLAFLVFIFCFYFFRNPERVCPEALIDATVIVCPADGKVVDIQYDPNGGFKGYHQKISIFMSPLNVHVNRMPVSGTIEKIEYVPGQFMMAFLPKSSELNEHNDITIKRADGKSVLVRQIAGTVARRIVWWVKEGQEVSAGQRYGMIKFSSRVDVYLPEEAQLDIKMGQKVFSGKTVIGRLA